MIEEQRCFCPLDYANRRFRAPPPPALFIDRKNIQEANANSIVAVCTRVLLPGRFKWRSSCAHALYFVALFRCIRHYFAAFVRDYRLFLPGPGIGTRVFLHFAFNIPSPMRRVRRTLRHDASGPSAWMVAGIFRCVIVCTPAASLFSRVSKARKCRDGCYRAIPI